MKPHPNDLWRLAWMDSYAKKHGYTPSPGAICREFGWSDIDSVRLFVKRMQANGWLDEERNVTLDA